jgi:hypothetical protein
VTQSRLHRYTYADYVGVESTSSTKHEFLDGEIYAMAGGSEDHSALAIEVLAVLRGAVGDRPCRVHSSVFPSASKARASRRFPTAPSSAGRSANTSR